MDKEEKYPPSNTSIYSAQVEELVAIGASIAANCDTCFKFHYNEARKLGVSKDDMLLAVETANAVKNTPAKAILSLARRYLMNPDDNNLEKGPTNCGCGCK
jgi:AhpD family alkylhydroperoxidase